MKETYYSILWVNQDATSEEIKKAYKKLAFKYHPDKNQENPEEATRLMGEVNTAYQTLSDEIKRREYDSKLNEQQEEASTFSWWSWGIKKIEFFKVMSLGDWERKLVVLNASTNELVREVYTSVPFKSDYIRSINENLEKHSFLPIEKVLKYIKGYDDELLKIMQNNYVNLKYDKKWIYLVNWSDQILYTFTKNEYDVRSYRREDVEEFNRRKMQWEDAVKYLEQYLWPITKQRLLQRNKDAKIMNKWFISWILVIWLMVLWISKWQEITKVLVLLIIPVVYGLIIGKTLKRYFKNDYS